jgi:hypothetical protein
LVLRQGRSAVDLGVFYDGVPNPALTDAQHFLGTGSATSSAGYTYDYLAPAFLEKPNATVASGGGYSAGAATGKALVLNNQTSIRVGDAQRLLELAKQGLRIFVIGDAPSKTPAPGWTWGNSPLSSPICSPSPRSPAWPLRPGCRPRWRQPASARR